MPQMETAAVPANNTLHQQNCRVCRSPLREVLFVISDNKVVRCLRCRHVYLDVIHTSETLRQMYEDYGDSGLNFYFQGIDQEVTSNLDIYLRRCRQYVGNHRKLRLLDIGCGTGTLMTRAAIQGFDCQGIEICEGLAQVARRQFANRVHGDFLNRLNFPANSIDVVTMYDLIEHLPDPAGELHLVHGLLKPGGILFMLTPNDDALFRRIARMAYHCSFHNYDRPMKALYYDHHLSYFTTSSLTTLIQTVGFHLVAAETRNQEMSRLKLSRLEKIGTRIIFRVSEQCRSLGGKLLLWARK
jgi:2-polyprenyl-3-methyl-5-hydroxy-6-metoxy-1,4-benzoquinol methylase